MGFYQFFMIFICNTYLILFNTFTAAVDYDGSVSVREGENFTITCNASLFAYIKWRLNDMNGNFGGEDISVTTRSDRFGFISTLMMRLATRTHTGRYKCSDQSDDFGHNLTVLTDTTSYSLELSGQQCTPALNTNASPQSSSASPCIVRNPFEKFSLECKSSPDLSSGHTIAWYHGTKTKSDFGTLVQGNEKIQLEDNNRKLIFKSLDVPDNGVYHCRVMKQGEEKSSQQYFAQQSVEILVLPRVSNVRKDVTAIEENPINLNCTVVSSVPVKVIWHVDTPSGGNKTYEASEGRIELQGNETLTTNNMLVVKSANMTLDRGTYVCYAKSEYGNSSSTMTFLLRVKSKYAALWPFLGICTEVIILCVIILIYEKKRDKTELEESDTDQGPETKSSPDHGQDNVRYRK